MESDRCLSPRPTGWVLHTNRWKRRDKTRFSREKKLLFTVDAPIDGDWVYFTLNIEAKDCSMILKLWLWCWQTWFLWNKQTETARTKCEPNVGTVNEMIFDYESSQFNVKSAQNFFASLSEAIVNVAAKKNHFSLFLFLIFLSLRSRTDTLIAVLITMRPSEWVNVCCSCFILDNKAKYNERRR